MIYKIIKALSNDENVDSVVMTKEKDKLIANVSLKNMTKDSFAFLEQNLKDFNIIDKQIHNKDVVLTFKEKSAYDLRDELLKIRNLKSIAEFKHMSVDMVNKLIKMPYGIDVNFKGKYAPKQSVFVDWMNKHPEFKASGFVTARNRDDCGVYIDAIEATLQPDIADNVICQLKDTFDDATGFVKAKNEDDNSVYVYCWYD